MGTRDVFAERWCRLVQADIREHMTALWGIRVSVKGGFCVGVTFQEEETIPDPFLTGRVVIPVVSHRMWSVHNVICEVADMDLRLKEFPSSSAPPAGPPPPSTPWDDTKLKLLAVAHFRIAQPNAKQLSDMVAQSPVRPGSRSARPKSGYPYLYNCDIDGLRVLVNLHSRDLLLQLADAYLSVVLSSLPSYQRPPKHLMDASSRSSTTPNTTPRIPGGSSFPSVPISPSSLIWNKLFHITARSFQISVMDEAKNGIILVTGNRVRVTNHVTTTAHRERIHLEVSDLCVYIAPTDVDVGAVYPWLWNFDEGKPVLYSSTSTLNSSASKIVGSLLGLQGESAPEAVGIGHTGIFKAVTSPFPVSCTIMVSHQQNEELAAAWLLVPVLPQPPSPDDVTSVRVSASVASLTVHLEAKEFVIVYDIVMHTLMAPLPPNMKLFVPKAPVDDILEPEV